MSRASTTVQNFLDLLDGVRADGSGWSARCPCRQDDENPSLHVGEGRDGRVLVTCHRGGGCDLNAICDAMDITPNDLFPPKTDAEVEREKSEWKASKDREKSKPKPKPKLKLVATYDFHDADGNLLFQKQRYLDEDGKKTFRQRKRDDNGEWVYSLGDTPKVLYNLPAVRAAAEAGDVVWLVEGEKDADTIIELGGVATTMPGGAGKWLDIHTEALVGAEVYLVRDNDSPGIDHALKVHQALTARDIDVVLCMPPLEHKDVTDFIDAGGDLVDLTIWTPEDAGLEFVQEPLNTKDATEPDDVAFLGDDDDEPSLLDDLIAQIEKLKTKDLSSASLTGRLHSIIDRLNPSGDPTLDSGRLVDWGSFIDEEVDDSYDWVIPGMLERMDRVIVVAAEGVGKTMLARQVAIASAAGVHPFTYEKMPPIRTLTIDLENPERIIRRMSTSMVGAARRLSGGRGPLDAHILIKPAGIDLLSAHDRVLIEETIEKTKPDLVCLGPLYKSFTDPGTKTSEAVAVEVAKYLDYLRTTYGFALWMEHHAPLGSSSGRELRPFGSAVWSRWPEFGLTLEPDITADQPYTYKVGNFRGDRDVRHRPTKIKRGKVFPFEVLEFLSA
jgi:hypothetical protein